MFEEGLTQDKSFNTAKQNYQKYIIEYSLFSQIIILVFRLFGVFLGYFFLLSDNIFLILIGVIFLSLGAMGFLLNIMFQRMIFYSDRLETKWNIFGFKFSKQLLYVNTEVMRSNSVFGGTIMFWEKGLRWKTAYFFIIDLLPLNQEKLKNIKSILIKNKIIKGDENEWIN